VPATADEAGREFIALYFLTPVEAFSTPALTTSGREPVSIETPLSVYASSVWSRVER